MMQHPLFSFELVRVNFLMQSSLFLLAFSGGDEKAAFSETIIQYKANYRSGL